MIVDKYFFYRHDWDAMDSNPGKIGRFLRENAWQNLILWVWCPSELTEGQHIMNADSLTGSEQN